LAEHGLEGIDHTIQQTYSWIDEIAAALGPSNRHVGYQVLRGFLHSVRDRLPMDEAVHLGAQLPMLLRGLYYEGWDPEGVPVSIRDGQGFLSDFAWDARLPDSVNSAASVRAAYEVLARHVTSGEVAEVLNALPGEVRKLLVAA
jgi:uncharacterized protein (DUF2267 family)